MPGPRPTVIKAIAALFMVAPVVNVLQVMILRGRPLGDLLAHPTLAFGGPGLAGGFGLVLVLLGPVVGVGIYSAKKWGFYLFLAYAASLLVLNSWLMVVWRDVSTLAVLAADVVIALVVTIMLRHDYRAPYLDDETRGWRRAKRVLCSIPANVIVSDARHPVEIVNVSAKGACIRAPELQVPIGDTLELALPNTACAISGDVTWRENDCFGIHIHGSFDIEALFAAREPAPPVIETPRAIVSELDTDQASPTDSASETLLVEQTQGEANTDALRIS